MSSTPIWECRTDENETKFLYAIFIDPFVQMVELPDFLLQVLWEGFVAGVLYALIALGFVLIFKASGVFNFAQGIMVVFAATDAGRPA
jgi:branched-chain amino acid transport system permease protein